MKKIHHYHRRFRLSLIRAGMLTVIACIFLMPSYVNLRKRGIITLQSVSMGRQWGLLAPSLTWIIV